MILEFFRPMLPPFSALALILISPTDIWELKSCGRKVSPNTHWCANAIRGAGLSLEDIIAQQLPVPHREMLPITLEEQLICFADKFFSKTHLDEEKTVEKARQSIAKYGEEA